MLRISRMTDYAFILLTRLEEEDDEVVPCSALAEQAPLPLPTVRKVCKKLSNEGLLVSHQGAHGGYELDREPGDVTVAEIVEAMEGPIAVTLCNEGDDACEIRPDCPVDDSWRVINDAIRDTLDSLTLADMRRPLDPETVPAAELTDPSRPSSGPQAATDRAHEPERRSTQP